MPVKESAHSWDLADRGIHSPDKAKVGQVSDELVSSRAECQRVAPEELKRIKEGLADIRLLTHVRAAVEYTTNASHNADSAFLCRRRPE
jgi:hypothetical protein